MDVTAAAVTADQKARKKGDAVAVCLANGWAAAMDTLEAEPLEGDWVDDWEPTKVGEMADKTELLWVASSGRKMVDEMDGVMELNWDVPAAVQMVAKSEQRRAAWSAGEKVPRKDLLVVAWMATQMVAYWE